MTENSEGQVSEVSGLGDPDEAISDGDTVDNAAPAGPDAIPNEERQDRHPDKGDVETTG